MSDQNQIWSSILKFRTDILKLWSAFKNMIWFHLGTVPNPLWYIVNEQYNSKPDLDTTVW